VSTVIVHLAPGRGPVGVWRTAGSEVECYYPAGYTAEHDTAAALMHARGNDVPWPAWFTRLAERASYSATFTIVEADPALSLPSILSSMRMNWNAARH